MLEWALKPVLLLKEQPEPVEKKSRGRPSSPQKPAKDAYRRRRSVYVALKVRPENARKQASQSAAPARRAIGEKTRAAVDAAIERQRSAGRSTDTQLIADLVGRDPTTIRRAMKRRT